MRDLDKTVTVIETETNSTSDGKLDKVAKGATAPRFAKSLVVKLDISKKNSYSNNVYS